LTFSESNSGKRWQTLANDNGIATISITFIIYLFLIEKSLSESVSAKTEGEQW
jgi:hypothetical protein